MRLAPRRTEDPGVNLTSLIDVVLLLLIFFMVSTSFIKESQITLRLPEAEQTPLDVPPASSLEILVTADGRYFVNDRELVNNRRETLVRALAELDIDTDVPVTISADADARFQLVITATDVAGKAGFEAVGYSVVNLTED
ncbi:MAG: biopolymer transporter ExbD [Pseudomonadota bacterium]